VVITTLCCSTACLDFKKKNPRDGELVQVFHYGGPGDDRATAITSLDDGGFVMAGIHGGGEVFDGIDLGDPIGAPDAFVSRMDRLGNPVWVVKIAAAVQNAGLSRVFPHFVAIGGNDTVVVGTKVDAKKASVELVGSGVTNEFDLSYQPESAPAERFMGALIFAFDLTDGQLLWQSVNGPGCITAGDSGSVMVYVAGVIEKTTLVYLDVNLDGGVNGDDVAFPTNLDCSGTLGDYQFLAAYTVDDGEICWAVPVVGCSKGFDLAVEAGHLALAGRFENGLGFVTNPDEPSHTDTDFTWECEGTDAGPAWECEEIVGVGDSMDTFVAYLDAEDGAAEWARRIGGSTGNDAGFGVTFTSDGLVVAGTFETRVEVCEDEECSSAETVLETSGGGGMFLAKYSPIGELVWATHAEAELAPESAHYKKFSLEATESGGLIVGGGFSGTATFGPGGPGAVVLESFGGEGEPFIVRYNPDSTLRWARSECGKNAEGAIHAVAPVTLAGEQIFLAAGGFEGTAIFGAGEANQTTLVSEAALPGDQDIFVLQLRDE
jgi:hypothetical protein